MPLNEQEKLFLLSIKSKIETHSIDVDLKEAFTRRSKIFATTIYNDGSEEIVDTGIEIFLCSISFFYWLCKYAIVEIPGSGNFPMEPYFFQQEAAKEIEEYRKIVTLKTRQAGISTFASFYCLWRCTFKKSENIDVVSTKQLKAQQFVKKMKPTMKSMPDWMKPKVKNENTQMIVWEFGDGSTSQILSESQSENAGRGDSLSLLVLDEVSFYQSDKMVRTIISSAQPTLTKTGGQLFLISTPNGISGAGSYYYEQIQSILTTKPKDSKLIQIDWWMIPDESIIKGPKKGYNEILGKAIEENYYKYPEVLKKYRDIFEPIARNPKNNPWLKAQLEDLQDVKYKQEILHEFILSGNKVFSEEELERVFRAIKEPIEKDRFKGRQVDGLWFWKTPKEGKRYIITCDVAKGTSNDYSSFQVFDVEDYEQVCEYKNLLSTPAFAALIKDVARYYNEAYCVVESNGVGEAVFTKLYYDEYDPYGNLYKEFKKNKKGETIATGWTTTQATRLLMTNTLIDWIKVEELFSSLKLYSERTYNEMTTWIYGAGGRPIHVDGAHDDLLIALSLALQNRHRAINSGQSFMIDEDGKILAYENSKFESPEKTNFGILTSDSDNSDEAMSQEIADAYNWLIGS